jgi:hypothetical protein
MSRRLHRRLASRLGGASHLNSNAELIIRKIVMTVTTALLQFACVHLINYGKSTDYVSTEDGHTNALLLVIFIFSSASPSSICTAVSSSLIAKKAYNYVGSASYLRATSTCFALHLWPISVLSAMLPSPLFAFNLAFFGPTTPRCASRRSSDLSIVVHSTSLLRVIPSISGSSRLPSLGAHYLLV